MQYDNFIYALHCPYTTKPVYVGQTTKGMNRPFQHIKEKSHSDKVNEWVNLLKEDGREPILVILEHGFDDILMNAKEKFWIDYYISKGHYLLNMQYITPLTIQSLEFDYLDPSDPLFDIRVYVKTRRRLFNLTQVEFCNKCGVGLRFLRELEQGTKTNFNTDSIMKVLNSLGRVTLTIKEIK